MSRRFFLGKDFKKFRQPRSKSEVNALDESIGFSFNRTPSVKSRITQDKDNIVIEILEFLSEEPRSNRSSVEKQMKGFDLLSAIFIDENYNGNEFIMTQAFFSDELNTSNNILKIILDRKNIGKKIMIVYTDIYGNDFTESFDI